MSIPTSYLKLQEHRNTCTWTMETAHWAFWHSIIILSYHPLQSTVKKECGMALYTVHGHNNMITGMFYLSLHVK